MNQNTATPSFSQGSALEPRFFIPFYIFAFVAVVILAVRIPITLEASKPRTATVAKAHDPRAVAPKEGYIAPDFILTTSTGENIQLSDLRGNIVFLNFWATWCKPCRNEMPSMQVLWERFKNEKFVMLAVSIDKDHRNAVEPFMKELGLTMPVMYDPESKAANLYETTGVPETFIIAKNGRILFKAVGEENWADPDAVSAFDSLIHDKLAPDQQDTETP